MSLKYHFMNFYDSDFDSQNESKIFDDNDDLLNKAFIESPEKSISCLLDDSSLNNLHEMLDDNDEKTHRKKIRDQKINKISGNKQTSELSSQGNRLKTTDVFFRKKSPPEGDIKLHSTTNSAYLDLNKKNWVSLADRNSKPKFGNPYSEIETKNSEKTRLSKKNEENHECIFSSTCLQEIEKTPKEYDWSKFAKRSFFEMDDELDQLDPKFGNLYSEIETKNSEKTRLSKQNEENPECIFTSTCLQEFEKMPKEYDWSKFEKRSFFEMDDESEKLEPKIRVAVRRSDYEYHELSTIEEVDSVFIDESDESLMNLNEYSSFLNHEAKITKFLKANDSFDVYIKQKASSSFPVNVMQVIQNKHMELLLQEPGILEESDLTLISTNLDSLSRIAEKSYEQVEESPSLISFLQHEISCMEDCTDE